MVTVKNDLPEGFVRFILWRVPAFFVWLTLYAFYGPSPRAGYSFDEPWGTIISIGSGVCFCITGFIAIGLPEIIELAQVRWQNRGARGSDDQPPEAPR